MCLGSYCYDFDLVRVEMFLDCVSVSLPYLHLIFDILDIVYFTLQYI